MNTRPRANKKKAEGKKFVIIMGLNGKVIIIKMTLINFQRKKMIFFFKFDDDGDWRNFCGNSVKKSYPFKKTGFLVSSPKTEKIKRFQA